MKRKNTRAWQDQVKVDFSADCGSFQEELRERLMQTLDRQADDHTNIKEGEPMKGAIKYSARTALIAALVLVLVAASALAVVNAYKLGPFVQFNTIDAAEHAKMDAQIKQQYEASRKNWEGKIFDEKGNSITDLFDYFNTVDGGVYDADGNRVMLSEGDDGLVMFVPYVEVEEEEDPKITFPTLEAAKPYMAFDPVLPKTLPSGYRLDHLEMYGEQPQPGRKYLTAVYTGPGGEMLLMMQLMDEETAFGVTGGGPIRSIKVAGHPAVVEGEVQLSVLVGDVLYSYLPCDTGVTLDEQILMAESAK